MGLLDVLAPGNPITGWLDQNRLAVTGGFQGLANASPNDPRGLLTGAVNGMVSGSQADYTKNLAAQQLALQVQQREAAADWLSKNGHPELAGPVRTGAITGSDAFNLLNKQTVVPAGSTVIDGQGHVTTPGGTGGFVGNDLKSQAWNTVMLANQPGADPAMKQDPKFLSAWAIVTEPTSTPQGMIQPQVPPNWGPGSAGPAQTTPANTPATGPAASPAIGGVGMGSDVAPIGSMANAPQGGSAFPTINPSAPPQTAPGIIQGTKPFNESQNRTNLLAQSAVPDVQRVIAGYPSLMSLKNQLLGKMGAAGRPFESAQYQQASDAVANSMVNMLYVASGANLNKDEWKRKVDVYLPSIGDKPETAVAKLERFANDMMSLANATADPQTVQWAQRAIAGIKQTEQQMLAGGSANSNDMSIDDLVKKYGG